MSVFLLNKEWLKPLNPLALCQLFHNFSASNAVHAVLKLVWFVGFLIKTIMWTFISMWLSKLFLRYDIKKEKNLRVGLAWVKQRLILVFVFQGGSARTTIAEGPNPAWNQQLSLTFKSSNNDFSPDTLNRVKDCLYLHLFDEVSSNS